MSGMLKIGYDADIILVDFNDVSHFPTFDIQSALVYNTNGSHVLLTMVQGKILYNDNQFTTIDLVDIKKQINEIVLPLINNISNK